MTKRNRPCPIASRVADAVIERSRVGFKKYGVNADRGDLTIIQWLQHYQEENLDAAVYAEKVKKEIQLLIDRNEKLDAVLRFCYLVIGSIPHEVSFLDVWRNRKLDEALDKIRCVLETKP